MRNFRWVMVSRLAQACSADAFHPYVQAALQAAADAGAARDVEALTADLAYEVSWLQCSPAGGGAPLTHVSNADRDRLKCCALCVPCSRRCNSVFW